MRTASSSEGVHLGVRQYLTMLGDIALAGEIPLGDLLQRIVETARHLLNARYAALGVFDGQGRVRDFYTDGLSTDERARIQSLPVGTGLLGYIVRERRIVRCARIHDHPASVGFPPNHPSMTSFLGGPIARGSVVYGNLYLTDRIGATEFSAEDEEMLALLARQSAIAIENAQRFAHTRREEQTTRALFEIGKNLASLSEPQAVVEMVVRSALDLLDADVAGLGLRESGPQQPLMVRWTLLRGNLNRFRQGRLVPAQQSLAGRVFQTGIGIAVDDVRALGYRDGDNPLVDEEDVRAMAVVPLPGDDVPSGALMVGWRVPGPPPEGSQHALARLADRAAIALAQAGLHARAQAALRQSEIERSSLEAIFDSMRDAVFTTGLNGRIIRLNRQATTWADGNAIGKTVPEVFHLENEQGKATALSAESGVTPEEINLCLPSGEKIPVEKIVSPIRDASGHTIGTVQVLRDLRPQREVEQLKANILSLVSHELRTPLSHIKGYASSLLQPDVEWDVATQRDFISSIERQADRLGRLISDLLEISRLDAGGAARLEPVPIAPSTLVERGMRQAAPYASGHSVTAVVPPDLPVVLADPGHVERVLSNLIENAAKYSPEGAPITVTVTAQDSFVTFAVEDRGHGLTLEEQSHLFERFYRSPRVKHRTPGTGLGLAICREIVHAHGGKIWVESVEGVGSVFRFTLPRVVKGDSQREEDAGIDRR